MMTEYRTDDALSRQEATADASGEGKRLDQLAAELFDLTRSTATRMIEEGDLLVNQQFFQGSVL